MTQAFNLSQLANKVNTSGELDASTGLYNQVPVINGGTGQSSYTNGQLLIGNTTGNTLTKSTLTAGANVTITNGAGSITIASSAVTPDIQTFLSTGTWTKPSGFNNVRIQMWGGGGGGGRGATTAATGAGGGGGYFELTIPITKMGATAAITVGGGGAGRTGSTGAGVAGGNSGVTLGSGSTIYVSGGTGGLGGGAGGSGGFGGMVFSAIGLIDKTPSPSGNSNIGSGGAPCSPTQDGYSYTGGGGGTGQPGGGVTGGKGTYGGGGGTRGTGAGGTSVFAGAGGNSAGAGIQPSGGGGASSAANTNGTAGAAGQVIITSF